MVIWTLRKKILIGYGIVLALMVVIFVWSFVNLLYLGQASDAILRENYKSILAAENMIEAIERQDSATLLIMLDYMDEGLTQFRENESQFLQWLGRAKDNITVQGEDKIVNTIETGYSSYLVSFSKLRFLYQTDKQASAPFYHGGVLPSFKLVRDECIRLREINQSTMTESSDRARRIAGTAVWSIVIIGITAMGIGLVFSLMLSNILVRPLRQIMEATRKIAEGGYDVEIPSNSSDELGSLASHFNTMVKKVKSYHDMNIGQIVAEKQKSESVIRSIDDGIIVVDSEFRITNINPTAAKAFGIGPEEAQNKHFLEIIRSEQLFKYMKQLFESQQPLLIEEGEDIYTIQHGEEQRHYQFSITPIKAGPMLEAILLLRDVTKLRELDRLKSEFVMMASHELRTPLTSIGMSIDLLTEGSISKLNEKEQQLLLAAHEEVQRLKALVSDLLDLSKIEAGKVDMEFDKVSVSLLFEKAVAVLKTQADEKSIKLSFEAKEGLPQVKADPNKITWVLTNLISNAMRYTSAGGNIRLAAVQVYPQVHILVSDDGTGIPYEYQSRIFDKFVQVKGEKAGEGSGLGLAICKEIVRAHGGTIWVDSTPGQGSTFTFTLPIVK